MRYRLHILSMLPITAAERGERVLSQGQVRGPPISAAMSERPAPSVGDARTEPCGHAAGASARGCPIFVKLPRDDVEAPRPMQNMFRIDPPKRAIRCWPSAV